MLSVMIHFIFFLLRSMHELSSQVGGGHQRTNPFLGVVRPHSPGEKSVGSKKSGRSLAGSASGGKLHRRRKQSSGSGDIKRSASRYTILK